uniref:Uncharacterized protein n=1 Tax=Glossina brevipalpis TaxID=37001 RepID=A0A1A9WID6_9MUSC
MRCSSRLNHLDSPMSTATNNTATATTISSACAPIRISLIIVMTLCGPPLQRVYKSLRTIHIRPILDQVEYCIYVYEFTCSWLFHSLRDSQGKYRKLSMLSIVENEKNVNKKRRLFAISSSMR